MDQLRGIPEPVSQSIPKANDGAEQDSASASSSQPATLTAQHRAYDEAAAQLVAAWDVEIDSRTPAEGLEALERLRSVAQPPAASLPPTALAASDAYDSPLVLPRRRSISRYLGWSAAAAVALTAGWFAVRGSGSEQARDAVAAAREPATELTTPAPQATTPDPASAAGPGPAAAPTEPAGQAAGPTRFALTVRTIPPDATLEIDGQQVANPYVGEHEPAATLKVTAHAEGHEVAERELELDDDVNLMVTLTPLEQPTASKRESRKRERRAHPPRERHKKTRPARRRSTKPHSSKGAGFVSSNPYQ